MKTQQTFRALHAFALTMAASRSRYVCLSEGSRAQAWRRWKDWEEWPVPVSDGPIHDNKKFVTRYGNGATVEFLVGAAS